MYNSRPRYSRYTSQINVPENYSGNAFRGVGEDSEVIEVEASERDEVTEQELLEDDHSSEDRATDSIAVHKKASDSKGEPFGLDIGRLFKGGIGFEELLIVGLILLMAQGEENDDIVLLLALLLFIK